MVTPKTFHVKPMQQCILTVETPLCHAEVFLIKQWQLIQIIAYLSSLFRIRAIRVVKQIQYFFTVIRSCQDHTYLLVFHWIDNQVVLIQERITSIIFRVHDGADMIFSSYTFYLFNNLRIPPLSSSMLLLQYYSQNFCILRYTYNAIPVFELYLQAIRILPPLHFSFILYLFYFSCKYTPRFRQCQIFNAFSLRNRKN